MSAPRVLLSSIAFILGFCFGGFPELNAGGIYVYDGGNYGSYGNYGPYQNRGLPNGFYPRYTNGFYSEYGRYNSCVGEACSRGGFNCSLESDLTKVIGLCRNAGNQCVSVACDESGDCGTEGGLQKIVQSCQWVDGACVRDACDNSGDCGLDEGLYRIIRLCRVN